MTPFKAFRIHEREGRIVAGFEQVALDALTPGDVVIRVRYSSINYKDALAATGAGKILRKYPLNGGIDLSGEVVSSTDERYRPGQPVLVTGCGHSETLDGGLVYDLVYNPPSTRLLADAAARGCEVIGGLDMLVAQAAAQFTWWTGAPAPVPVMRAAALARLQEEHRTPCD